MGSVVLVTGVSRVLGSRLAAQLAADPGIERIIGVDTVAPSARDVALLGRTQFVRADIRHPMIAKIVGQAGVGTVVHTALFPSPDRAAGQHPNVLGAMQLLAACQQSDTVHRVVVRSTGAVYGSSPRDPAVFTEDMHPRTGTRGGYAKDAVEVEAHVRGFARRRPDIGVTVLRMADLVGPNVDAALRRYLAGPLAPTPLGFDARLQFLHESDAVEVLRLAAVSSRPGVVNVAGAGVLTLHQLLRRAGRLRVPVPAPALGLAGLVTRNGGIASFGADESRLLRFGRVLSTERLRSEFGYTPRYTSAEALDAYLQTISPLTRLAVAGLDAGARMVAERAERRRAAAAGAG